MINKSTNNVFFGVISGICEKFKLNTMLVRFFVIMALLIFPFKYAFLITFAYIISIFTMGEPIYHYSSVEEKNTKDGYHL